LVWLVSGSWVIGHRVYFGGEFGVFFCVCLVFLMGVVCLICGLVGSAVVCAKPVCSVSELVCLCARVACACAVGVFEGLWLCVWRGFFILRCWLGWCGAFVFGRECASWSAFAFLFLLLQAFARFFWLLVLPCGLCVTTKG